jgi:hypothetical protein
MTILNLQLSISKRIQKKSLTIFVSENWLPLCQKEKENGMYGYVVKTALHWLFKTKANDYFSGTRLK